MAGAAAHTYPEPTRRRHPRVPADFQLTAHAGGRAIQRRVLDLSMTGLKLQGEAEASDRWLLELPLPEQGRTVFLKSRVMRRESAATAMCFENLDWGDICALARFLAPRLP